MGYTMQKWEGVMLGIFGIALLSSQVGSLVDAEILSDCSQQDLVHLIPCLDFLTGRISSPRLECCEELTNVLATHPACLCELGFGGNTSISSAFNATLTNELPKLCKIKFHPTWCPHAGESTPPPSGSSTSTLPSAPSQSTSSPPPSTSVPPPPISPPPPSTSPPPPPTSSPPPPPTSSPPPSTSAPPLPTSPPSTPTNAPPPPTSELTGSDSSWSPGHVTYYGGSDASGTNGGACGYQNVFSLGYGTMTAAISDMIYDGGLTCGACYEVKCSDEETLCYGNSIIVTATNQSPQWSTATPGAHLDLSQPAFEKLGQAIAGHFVVQYRRVDCEKQGGVKFFVGGQTYWMNVLVSNVGGAGDVHSVSVQGGRSGWIQLTHTWGQNWSTGAILDGQSLSFSITTSDGKTLESWDVTDSTWSYGQTFEGSQY